MSNEGQESLDLGIDVPEPPDIDKVREEMSREIGDAARARDEQAAQDRPPLPEGASVQERLGRRLADIEARDDETNRGVSPARREETSEVLMSHSANADIDEQQERERQRLADQRAADATAEHDRDLADRRRRAAAGRAEIAKQWTPPLTEAEKEIARAKERGRQARGETDPDPEPDSQVDQ